MRKLLLGLTLVVIMGGCSSSRKSAATFTNEKALDVSYGSFPSSKMDVYLPAGRSKESPFVVLIHGGGWIKGDKRENRGAQQIFMDHGIASINLNYRFADSISIHYPEMIADIDSAIDYCVAHAKAWNTRKNNFVMMGASAGGHLSLLYGYTTNKKVNAIVGQCAPTDFTDTATINYEIRIGLLPIIEAMAGAKYIPGEALPPEFAASSPIYHVKNIPTLLIHGTGDQIVPFAQAEELYKKLLAENIPAELIPIPGANHDMNMKDKATVDMVFKEIVAWVLKYGK